MLVRSMLCASLWLGRKEGLSVLMGEYSEFAPSMAGLTLDLGHESLRCMRKNNEAGGRQDQDIF